MPLTEATRDIMWNISFPGLMYILLFVSLIIFGYGVIRHIRLWKEGLPHKEKFAEAGRRVLIALRAVFTQKKTFNTGYPGIFHALIFYAFLVLLLTTTVILLDYDVGTTLFSGGFYLMLTLACEIAGALMLVGIAMALFRRLVTKPETLDTSACDTAWLVLLAAIVISGFIVEGLRISAAGDPWRLWSPLGWLCAVLFASFTPQSTGTLHVFFWWLHAIMVMAWIAIIPYTKLFHILLIPANAYLSKIKPAGELSRIDIEALMERDDLDEEDFNIGLGSMADFTWKQRMELDACLSCGRCEAVCPASRAGQPLSPKTFVQNMRDLIVQTGAGRNNGGDQDQEAEDIIPGAFDENFIWFCRTCLACVEICPAYIGHVDTLIEIRRNEVNMKGRLPVQAAQCLKTMESMGNPFGPQNERIKWINNLDVPVIQPGESCDVLYWIGCFTSLDADKQKIASDMCQLMRQSGTDFGVLGEGEHCCGDPARVAGEENMFQMMAKGQVEELNSRKFNTLLVSCPHGYNVLKNEYPQFGGHYPVVHYTEFLLQLLDRHDLALETREERRVAYHDPCYLGRYQGIYSAPRKIIDRISGISRVEMPDYKGKSLCCGGGGGHFWMDFKEGDRINNLRVEQARKEGIDTIVTSCPYCLHMLDDSVKLMNFEDQLEVVDIGSLVLNCIKI